MPTADRSICFWVKLDIFRKNAVISVPAFLYPLFIVSKLFLLDIVLKHIGQQTHCVCN